MSKHFQDLAKDFSLIRLKGKRPIEKDWTIFCHKKRNYEEIGFEEGENAGIATGPASGLIVVDVDDLELFQETCKSKYWEIPDTLTHETGSGKPHYLLKYPNGDKSYGNKSLKNYGFDIRGVGGQVVAPGSIHPETGRPYRITTKVSIADPPEWLLSLYDKKENVRSSDEAKTEIDIKTLPIRNKTKKLITKNIPVGERSEAMMTALNALVGAGVADDEIFHIFESYPIGEKYREKGDNRVSWLQPQIDKARSWINSSKPKIDAECQDLPKITSEAWKALLKYNDPPVIFHHSDGIVRISNDANGIPKIVLMKKDNLRYDLARSADWYKISKNGRIRTYPPSIVCMDISVDPNPPLPQLEMLIYHPLYSEKRILHLQEGYDENTKCYFIKPRNLTIPKFSEKPTQNDISRAKRLIDDLLHDFPFTGTAEKAHSVGILILPFVRPMIKGPTPMHNIEAPTPGTGKTLMAKCLTYPSTGPQLQVLTEGRDEDEWRKRITSALRKQSGFLLIDNVRRKVDATSLASALTLTQWTDRILGQSNIVSLNIRCGWIMTGNNPSLSDEIKRRTVRIRLDAKTEKPWLRPNKEFRHPELLKWVEKKRGELIWATLVLTQSWIAEGCPKPKGIATLGMFEDWSNVIGGILQNANIPGFLENLDEFYESSDDEDPALKALIRHWWTMHGSRPVGVSELFKIIATFDIPLEIGGGESERGQKISLGKYLQRMRDRQIDGYRIVPGRVRHNTQQWKLEPSPPLTRDAGAISLEGGGSEISPEYPHDISEQNQPVGEKGDIGDVFKTDEKIKNISSSEKNSESKSNFEMVGKIPPHPHSDENGF